LEECLSVTRRLQNRARDVVLAVPLPPAELGAALDARAIAAGKALLMDSETQETRLVPFSNASLPLASRERAHTVGRAERVLRDQGVTIVFLPSLKALEPLAFAVMGLQFHAQVHSCSQGYRSDLDLGA
jgi:hypothetical protein